MTISGPARLDAHDVHELVYVEHGEYTGRTKTAHLVEPGPPFMYPAGCLIMVRPRWMAVHA